MLRKAKNCNELCPADMQVIDSISGKWTVLIVHVLAEKQIRSAQLRREVEGISDKVLTQRLRRLERDGLVKRQIFPTVPPQVEYSLTKLGRSLVELLSGVRDWAEKNYSEVKTARQKYDRR